MGNQRQVFEMKDGICFVCWGQSQNYSGIVLGILMSYYKWKINKAMHHMLIISCRLLGMYLIFVGL